MTEYLVRIALKRPEFVDDESWAALLAAEGEMSLAYRKRGVIQRIWRLPGTTSNVGIWVADDASELDRLLGGLPAFHFMTIQVELLALHYVEASD